MGSKTTGIIYEKKLLDYYFRCKKCKSPLLMFGCNNPNCSNYYKNNNKLLKYEKPNQIQKA